eukprot:GDKH01002069.1.p3 GENE.GDKH01002069.1~~GDKH01002069.1.p3  ORF type:complete len:69 (-),score=0.91 GDKH01002069.1:116-322(-)
MHTVRGPGVWRLGMGMKASHFQATKQSLPPCLIGSAYRSSRQLGGGRIRQPGGRRSELAVGVLSHGIG